MSELVMTISIAVQAAATIALVVATCLLVKHTKALAKVSDDLARIEEVREKRTQREKNLFDVRWAYELGEAILRVDPVILVPGCSVQRHSATGLNLSRGWN